MAHYMMATKAIHQLGDISRKEPDLCIIDSEDSQHFIGAWVIDVTGYGLYINVRFPKSTTRELTDEEKEEWHGRQIVIGDSPVPVRVIYTKEVEYAETKESPVIVFPEDETRKQQLRAKLVEYQGRMNPYRAPEMQMDTICKMVVLERLLRDGQVKTWDLSREMAETYGSGFDGNAFGNACGVIEDYCKTGGQNIHSGTGLRAPG